MASRRRKPSPSFPGAIVLARSGTLDAILRRFPAIFSASCLGDGDARFVLTDAFADLGAEVRPFTSVDQEIEAEALSDRFREAPEGLELFLLTPNGHLHQGQLRNIAPIPSGGVPRGPSYDIVSWTMTDACHRVIRGAPRPRVRATSAAHQLGPNERLTMAEVKRRVTAAGSPFFSRENSRGMHDRFWGPYVGPGGVFFLHRYRSGNEWHPHTYVIREVTPEWRVRPASADSVGAAEPLREEARRMAREGREVV